MADYTSIFTGAEIDGRLAGVVADFDPGKTYYVGDFAFRNNQVWRKVQNPGSGGWVAADWIAAVVGDGMRGTGYATFDVDADTGNLIMITPDGYDGPTFSVRNGFLEVTVNGNN